MSISQFANSGVVRVSCTRKQKIFLRSPPFKTVEFEVKIKRIFSFVTIIKHVYTRIVANKKLQQHMKTTTRGFGGAPGTGSQRGLGQSP